MEKTYLEPKHAEAFRKMYGAVRNGMDYAEAGEKFLMRYYDSLTGWKHFQEHREWPKESITEATEEKRLYELDDENLTITEVTE